MGSFDPIWFDLIWLDFIEDSWDEEIKMKIKQKETFEEDNDVQKKLEQQQQQQK